MVKLNMPKWVRMIEYLYEVGHTYPSKAARDTKITYSHAVHLLQSLERVKLVKSRKIGRTRVIKLTATGFILAGHLSEVLRLSKTETKSRSKPHRVFKGGAS